MTQVDVAVIGAGLAGLCCARKLHRHGIDVGVYEASDEVGGRIRTDLLDGFILDRGFQVFLTSYPEAQSVLDYNLLQLHPFEPGAIVRYANEFHVIADPMRMVSSGLQTLFTPIGSLSDKFRIALLRGDVCNPPLHSLFLRTEQTTVSRLKDFGFSDLIIERFFRPFFGGVFLERELSTSSRMFDFLFRMFSQGDATLPQDGMAAIPRQLSNEIPADRIHLEAKVEKITDAGVRLKSGDEIKAKSVVIATDGADAAALHLSASPKAFQSVRCLYFSADQSPVNRPILVLNGNGAGPINNICTPSDIAPGYAPKGQTLISVSVIGQQAMDESELLRLVQKQLKEWYGSVTETWRYLLSYSIDRALPKQMPPALHMPQRPVRVRPGLYICGDHIDNASINGAMVSGRRAAEALIEDLSN
ncbi:MAG: NAD(P)/FAD-dependent oxidoreductase [Candidatus Hinthialibacter antarcticus]|nr:NAD(P)/FAD-dependent oxidoreductase [Candidatus Hinthialibacter antarcticus]